MVRTSLYVCICSDAPALLFIHVCTKNEGFVVMDSIPLLFIHVCTKNEGFEILEYAQNLDCLV